MAPPKAQHAPDPYAQIAEQDDPYAGIAEPHLTTAQLMANKINPATGTGYGTYNMTGPDGKAIPVPYFNVNYATQVGYKITDPAVMKKFARDTAFDPSQPVQAGAAPYPGTPAWFKQKAMNYTVNALDALPTVGGLFGSWAGAGAGAETGPGAFATGAAGATAGGVLGEDIRQAAEEKFFPNLNPKMTPGQAAKAMAIQGGVQAAQDVTGRLGAKALSPMFKRFAQTALASKASGVRLLPSEAANKPSGTIENYMRGSLWTSAKMEKFRAAQNAETQAAVQKVADTISDFRGSPEELGEKVLEGIEQHTKQFRAVQKKMYDDIDAQVAEKTVQVPRQVKKTSTVLGPDGKPMTYTATETESKLEGPAMPSTAGLKAFAEQELETIEAEQEILDPTLLSSSKSMLEHIVNGPDRVTFGGMKDARSDLLAVTRRLEEALPGKMAGQAKSLAKLADEAMMDAAEKSGIEGLPEAVREANAFTANEHQMMERKLVKSILDSKKPVEGIASVIRGPASARRYSIGLQETRDLFKVLPPNMKAPVQRQIILDTLEESTNPGTGIFNEGKFAGIINRIGDGRGEIIFGSNWKNVKELSKLMEQINGPTSKKAGGSMAAALQNPEIYKDFVMALAPFMEIGRGHTRTGILMLLGEGVGYNTVAYALTHPATAAKLVKILQAAIQGAAYAPGLAYNETRPENRPEKLKDLREKAKNLAVPPKEQAKPAGPQSFARPYTHIFDEEKGMIVPA